MSSPRLCHGERLALRWRRDFARHRKHFRAAVMVVVLQEGDDPARVFVRCGRCGEDLEPGRQHLLPTDADLPSTSLVGKEDHVFVARVDVVEKAEDDVEGLPDPGGLRGLCLLDASIEEPAALRDPGCVPVDLLMKFWELTMNGS